MNRDIKYEEIELGLLKPNPRNARTHSRKQRRQIAASIRRFGFTNPVIIDDQNMILAGHGRVEAARDLGLTNVPCVRLSDMTPAEKKAYALADNKLALLSDWDEEILAQEFQELLALDLDFDVEITGFSIPEIDRLIEGLNLEEDGDPKDDKLPPLSDKPSVRPGDIWHRHSDCRSRPAPDPFAVRPGDRVERGPNDRRWPAGGD